jgi:hypothetical protein
VPSPLADFMTTRQNRKRAITGTAVHLLGCTERSSPETAKRRAEGAGLDGERADQTIIEIIRDGDGWV